VVGLGSAGGIRGTGNRLGPFEIVMGVVMSQGPRNQEELYLLWLEERWDAHKLDIHYGNGEREDKRTEDVLEMLKSIGELSKRSVDPPQLPPWEYS
jgi:hypothetical protein